MSEVLARAVKAVAKRRSRPSAEIARAVIEAMREPTEAMRSAGGAVVTSYPDGPSDVDRSVAAVTFNAMIDAALAEPQNAESL